MKKSTKDIIQVSFILTVLFVIVFASIAYELIKVLAYWKFLTH